MSDHTDNRHRRLRLPYTINEEDSHLIYTLLENGPNPNRYDGKSGLHIAAGIPAYGLGELLEYGERKQCLHISYKCYREVSYHCMVHQAKTELVNAKDNFGRTPLHYAANATNANILIYFGASLDVQDDDGRTPLHAAVLCERADVIEVLLLKGADVDIDRCVIETVRKLMEDFSFISTKELKKFIVKMNVAELDGFEPHSLLADEPKTVKFENKCRRELDKIRNVKFGSASLADVLYKYRDPLFARSTDLNELFESLRFDDEYPIYFRVLRQKMDQAKIRLKMLDKATVRFFEEYSDTSGKSGRVNLPLEVIRNIMSLLDNEDLRNVIRSTKTLENRQRKLDALYEY